VTHPRLALEARQVWKRYGHTDALVDVSLTLAAGEVHGLVGHNGAGKSTLLRLLAGAERPDTGTLLLGGEAQSFGSPREAIERGISCVYQELSLIENLTVAQNLFLGRELRRLGRLDLEEMERQTVAFLRGFELEVPPGQKVRELSVARRQLIERAREGAPLHAPVFRVERYASGSHAQHALLVGRSGLALGRTRRRVTRRHERGGDAGAREVLAEGANRSRDAVDAWKVDVGDEENPHAR